jgi:hypothetical protein
MQINKERNKLNRINGESALISNSGIPVLHEKPNVLIEVRYIYLIFISSYDVVLY